jgi:hypothetical protein
MRRHASRLLVISVALMMAVVTAAPAVAQQQQTNTQKPTDTANRPTTVDLDDLETNPEKYLGKTVTVEGEVDRVLGPHLFTVDERDWVDAEREMPVVVPEPFAAIVRSDAPVRVTGTVQKVPLAQIERDRGLLGDARIRAEIETKPVLVATDVTATQSGVSLRVRSDQPVGTSGATASTPVTDTKQVAQAKDKNLVGRRVDLSSVTVAGTSNEGFWIGAPSGERIFVMTTSKPTVKEGQRADVRGLVLELPEGLRVKVDAANEPIYIYADRVTTR